MGGSEIRQIRLRYEPFGKQMEFHRAGELGYRHRLYAGGFGSGKSFALIGEMIVYGMAYPGIRILLGRKTLGELKRTLLKDFFEICPMELISSHNKAEQEINFVNGSMIHYAPLDVGKGAVEKVAHGLNFGRIYLDELHEIEEEIYIKLESRLRQMPLKEGERLYPHGMASATNPNGHDWVWRKFISEERDKSIYWSVVAKTCDNPFLPEDYELNLRKNFPKRWCDRYLDASFDDFSGLVYPEFKEGVHCIKRFNIKDYEKRVGRRGLRFVAIDHGFRNPTAALWFWVHPQVLNNARTGWHPLSGKIYVYREYYESGQIVKFNAEMILNLTGDEEIEQVVIDPSCYNVDARDGNNIAGEYMKAGVAVTPANHELLAGLNRVREYLEVNAVTGLPGIYIFDNCVNTISEIGRYHLRDLKVNDDRNQPEEPIKKDDHAMDALRYGCVCVFEKKLRPFNLEDAELKRIRNLQKLGLDPRLQINFDEVFEDESPEASNWY